MGVILKFLLISAVIVVPWAIIRVADLEMMVTAFLRRIFVSDLAVVLVLVVPPLLLFLARWLFVPRRRKQRHYSGHQDIIIKFRG
jgi:hypothetical protein